MNHNDAIRLFAKMLQNVEKWMDKAAAHAKAKSFEVDVLAQARLAPDAYPFVRQVQAACDQAKFALRTSREAAAGAPRHRADVRRAAQRIQKCLSFLETVQAKDLAGAEDRKVAPPWLGGSGSCRRLPDARRDPELLLPRDDDVRDPPPQRRRARQDGLRRLASDEGS